MAVRQRIKIFYFNIKYYSYEKFFVCQKVHCSRIPSNSTYLYFFFFVQLLRRYYLSEAPALNDTNEVFLHINNSEDRESSNSSDPENIILDEVICHKIWTKKKEWEEIPAQKPGAQAPMPEVPGTLPEMQESKLSLEIAHKMISLVGSQLDYKPGASPHITSAKLETPTDKRGRYSFFKRCTKNNVKTGITFLSIDLSPSNFTCLQSKSCSIQWYYSI